jgi:DNA-directed RNA polymerase specialized sigma24 family protein
MRDTKKYRLLKEARWENICTRLLGFGIYLMQNYGWHLTSDSIISSGISVEDLVQTVIRKTLDGTRNWDPDKGDLEPWLRDQLKSEVSNLLCSSSCKKEVNNCSDYKNRNLLVEIKDQNDSTECISKSPEAILLTKEDEIINEREVSKRISALFKAVKGDQELEELLEEVMNGTFPKPSVLAEELGVEVKNIYNRIKRLKRKAIKFLQGEKEVR